MNVNQKTTTIARRVLLSTLWIFALVNYLYCDLISLMDSGPLKGYLAGKVGGIEITQGFLLAAGVLMQIPMSMILLSRVLNYRANRIANIIAGFIMTLVQVLTLVMSPPAMYYAFFSIFEIASTALIVWFAWNWRNSES